MHTFEFTRPTTQPEQSPLRPQATTAQQGADIRFIAGGTTLVDLMKLRRRDAASNWSTSIACRWTRSRRCRTVACELAPRCAIPSLAHDATVERDYSVLSQAILAGASTQIRNMATTAGNILQRTRCVYFRDLGDALQQTRARQRLPGDHRPQSDARDPGHERTLHRHESFGHVRRPRRSRGHGSRAARQRRTTRSRSTTSTCCPATRRIARTCLEPGDLITHIELPPPTQGSKQFYLKLRDRASYEFALASAAVILRSRRLATSPARESPWAAWEPSRGGRPRRRPRWSASRPHDASFRAAAEAALRDAKPQSQNGFKVELAKRCIIHALRTAAAA